MIVPRYQAALPDELDLRPGMKLKVLRLYDDAWGTAVIASGGDGDDGKQGAFPIVSHRFRYITALTIPTLLRPSQTRTECVMLNRLHRSAYPKDRLWARRVRHQTKGRRRLSPPCGERPRGSWTAVKYNDGPFGSQV